MDPNKENEFQESMRAAKASKSGSKSQENEKQDLID